MVRSATSRLSILLLSACFVLLFGSASAQQVVKRLILKDGSYQLATSWSVQGERVHYFSAERSAWEDVAASMVDWAATEKYEKDRAAGVPPPKAKMDTELSAELAADEATLPAVAPGLHLPEDGGVFVLDTFENHPQLVPLAQRTVVVKPGGQVDCLNNVCSDPSVRDKLEIAGPHAPVQVHVALPVLYVKLGQRPAVASQEELANRFRILRVQLKRNRRIVGAIRISYTGMAKPEEQNFIPVRIKQISGGWLEVIPGIPLPMGEYALVEISDSRKEMNLNMQAIYVPDNIWDFGVNPAAPANPQAIKPEGPGK